MPIIEAVRHHTDAEVKGYVETALRIVDEVELDDDLRGIAFSKAIELLSGKLFIHDQPAGPPMSMEHLLGKR